MSWIVAWDKSGVYSVWETDQDWTTDFYLQWYNKYIYVIQPDSLNAHETSSYKGEFGTEAAHLLSGSTSGIGLSLLRISVYQSRC